MQKIHWVHFGKCEEELHKICWVFLPSMTSQWWSRELLWHPSPISPANIFPLTTSCSWPTSLSRVRFRLCVDSHRPCSSRSGARQRGWSHFRCGKVSPGCYFLPSPRTNVRNRLFTLAPLSIINISRRKNWCLMWSGSLRFSSAANKWLQLRMKRRCGGQRSSCHAAGGEEMEEINKPRVVCCDGRSGSRVKCVSSISRSAVRYPLRPCVVRRTGATWAARSSYVFRNLTPDSLSPPQTLSRQPATTAADASQPQLLLPAQVLYIRSITVEEKWNVRRKTCCITPKTLLKSHKQDHKFIYVYLLCNNDYFIVVGVLFFVIV